MVAVDFTNRRWHVSKVRPGLISQRIPCGCFNGFRAQDADFIYAGKHWVLALNASQFFLGRSLLLLREHTTDLFWVPSVAMDEFHDIYCVWRSALERAFHKNFRSNVALLGNETDVHGGHLHWHFVPRYLEPISFRGKEYFTETPETARQNYSQIAERLITPPLERRRIAQELQRYFSASY